MWIDKTVPCFHWIYKWSLCPGPIRVMYQSQEFLHINVAVTDLAREKTHCCFDWLQLLIIVKHFDKTFGYTV